MGGACGYILGWFFGGICYNDAVMVKRIAILGSTGSIGKNALRVIDSLGPDYAVVALSAHSSVELLAEQARRYRPRFVAITDDKYEKQLGDLVGDLDVEVLAGPEGLIKIAELDDVDIFLTAVVGAAGLPAVLCRCEEGEAACYCEQGIACNSR
jgi:1-deoxy-D-xylulose-5-phosphate reductoisomerase